MMMSFSETPRRSRRVLIADDSEVMRAMLSEYVNENGEFEVVGAAATGYQAIRLLHDLDPDIVTLDLEMPDLGGVEVLGYIMSEAPRPVVIVSAQTEAMADPALTAMAYGAVEFVAKPGSNAAAEVDAFRRRLRMALHAATTARLLNLPSRLLPTRPTAAPPAVGRAARCAVAIAASTGGPRALADIVPALPADLAAAVIVVQHMPALFTAALARRLNEMSKLPVREAEHGMSVRHGCVYVAPGGYHLMVEPAPDGPRMVLTSTPAVWGVRPAADVLFPSIARTFGPGSVGVVLTGMGRDGAEGLRALREVGGWAIAQDEATSVIGSMPRAAAEHANVVLPLGDIGAEITARATSQAQLRSG